MSVGYSRPSFLWAGRYAFRLLFAAFLLFIPKGEGGTFLQNVSGLLLNHMALQPRDHTLHSLRYEYFLSDITVLLLSPEVFMWTQCLA
jgi:hypothetical protein